MHQLRLLNPTQQHGINKNMFLGIGYCIFLKIRYQYDDFHKIKCL